jgi:hypothetical protein
MRQNELLRKGRGRALAGRGLKSSRLARQAVGTQGLEKAELAATGGVRPTVGEVDDFALIDPIDAGVRLLDEAFQAIGKPMIAPRRSACLVHPLLDDRPMAVVGHDEAVQIEVKTILKGGAVHLRHEPAHVGESRSVESDALADRGEFDGRLARMLAAAAADVNAELAGKRLEATLQRADHARRDAGGVPVHAHHRAERLEPERVRKAAQQLVATIVMDDRLADHHAEAGHSLRKPERHAPAMQRQIGASSSIGHSSSCGSFNLRSGVRVPSPLPLRQAQGRLCPEGRGRFGPSPCDPLDCRVPPGQARDPRDDGSARSKTALRYRLRSGERR